MSIKDYSKKYIVINGTTNEQIRVPISNINDIVMKDYRIDDVLLVDTILEELQQSDTVTVVRTYMKD